MPTATLAHTLLAAHEDRVLELSTRYAALERAASKDGRESDAAEEAHRALGVAVVAWRAADVELERRDLVDLTMAESAALGAQIARAARHGDAAVRADLERAAASLREVPRATVVRMKRSLARLARLESLAGPAFIVLEEVLLLHRLLTPAAAAEIEAPPFDPERGFERTFLAALEATLVHRPGEVDAVDLGLGESVARSRALFPRKADPYALEESWRAQTAADHPLARAPFVPRGRFASCAPRDVARCDLEGTGPIGWARGEDVVSLAEEQRALFEREPELGEPILAMAQRVSDAREQGHAIIGFFEILPPEAEGHRLFLGDQDDDPLDDDLDAE